MWNKETVKPFKGQLVMLHKQYKEIADEITGEIVALTSKFIVFDVNKEGKEIMVSYDRIISITKLKSNFWVKLYNYIKGG
jgi:hypothetical protein